MMADSIEFPWQCVEHTAAVLSFEKIKVFAGNAFPSSMSLSYNLRYLTAQQKAPSLWMRDVKLSYFSKLIYFNSYILCQMSQNCCLSLQSKEKYCCKLHTRPSLLLVFPSSLSSLAFPAHDGDHSDDEAVTVKCFSLINGALDLSNLVLPDFNRLLLFFDESQCQIAWK